LKILKDAGTNNSDTDSISSFTGDVRVVYDGFDNIGGGSKSDQEYFRL